MKLGEIILRVPVTMEYESDDREYATGGFFYAQAGDPEVVSHTLGADGLNLVALELKDGDFWADANIHQFLPPAELSDRERNALHDRMNERYVAEACGLEPNDSETGADRG